MLVSGRVTPCVSCLIILITVILTDWADCVQYIEVSIALRLYYTSENIKVVSPTITIKSNQNCLSQFCGIRPRMYIEDLL